MSTKTYTLSIVRYPALGVAVTCGPHSAICDAHGYWSGPLAIDPAVRDAIVRDAIVRVRASGQPETVTVGASVPVSPERRAAIAAAQTRHDALMADMDRADSDH